MEKDGFLIASPQRFQSQTRTPEQELHRDQASFLALAKEPKGSKEPSSGSVPPPCPLLPPRARPDKPERDAIASEMDSVKEDASGRDREVEGGVGFCEEVGGKEKDSE